MKVCYNFLHFLFCFTIKAQAQTNAYPQWQHPILQEVRKENKNMLPFYNKDSTAFITISVIDKKQQTIYWFDCFGYYFDAVPISEPNIKALSSKAITAFGYYDLITTEYLKTITKARTNLQTNGKAALFTKYENQLLQINDSLKYPSTLKKLIELDKQKLSIERQIREFHSSNPQKIKDDTTFSNTLTLQYGAMETSVINGDSLTTYYNRIALEPVYKAVLNYKDAYITYYNRANQKIDSIQFEREKIALLLKEKTDVFLLYRGWLELNRFNITNSITLLNTTLKEVAKQQTKIDKAQYASTKNSLAYLLDYSKQLLKTTNYKIDYLTTIDRGFVSQCLKQQYKKSTNSLTANQAHLSTFTRGEKFYELTDMRGNVMAVVTDKKLAHSSNNTTIDYYEPDVVSATDYAPFGMPLAGRNVQSDKYRYGYNGKENDKETTLQDYGMRIYDPRLGRFLSVDPLTKSYPWNSTYAFAENDVIRSIDLDGLERVTTTIFNEQGAGKPGIALITIKKTFYLVTAGLGAMSKSGFDELAFHTLATKGNQIINLKTLAGGETQAEEASDVDLQSGNYYAAQIMYHYELIAKDNITINDAMAEVHKDNSKNGIIFNQLKSDEISQVVAGFAANGIKAERNSETDDYYRFQYIASLLSSELEKGADKGARAAGSNEGRNGVPYNLVVFGADYNSVKSSEDLTIVEDILHESGHNDAESNRHNSGNYEYIQNGTQSNVRGNVYHTKKNTINLLNDPSNRKATTTVHFDNSKLTPE